MTKIENQELVMPYPQEALGGKMGLTSKDVALAIGVGARWLVRDIKKRKYLSFLRDAGFEFVQICTKSGKRGRPGQMFVFNLEAAKAVVASSRTPSGAGYLRYLVQLEAAMIAAAPAFQWEREEVRTKGRKWRLIVGTRTEESPLFGDKVEIPVERKMEIREMTEDEHKKFQIQHLSRQSRGMSKKVEGLGIGTKKPDTKQICAKKRNYLEGSK